MKIYTRAGDEGETGLYRGGRIPKDSPRIAAYGTIDELNSVLGWVRSLGIDADSDALLARIQHDLFIIGADLSTPVEAVKPGDQVMRLAYGAESFLEAAIDRLDELLEPLRRFILPGGSEPAAALHVARTICRRAERDVVALARKENVNPIIVIYLNRLSDFLFTLAREMNRQAGRPDVPWESRESRG